MGHSRVAPSITDSVVIFSDVRTPLLCWGLILLQLVAEAQLLGGAASFNFLRLPAGAVSSAQGGLVVAQDESDLSLSFQNPALLTAVNHARVQASFLNLPGGAQHYFLSGSNLSKTSSLVTALSIQYVDHGEVSSADAGGNVLGRFRPREWTMQLAASTPYKQRWAGGVSLQFAHASYDTYRADALLSNIGIRYRDTLSGWHAGAVLRYTGFFIRRFTSNDQSVLPVELALGVWKKLTGSPFSIGCTIQRMQRWDLDADALYDPALSLIGMDDRQSTFIGQFFNHLILSTRVEVHSRIHVMGGYNFLRRRELSWAGGANGLSGFSYGLQTRLDPLRISFGRSHYQAGTALSQVSLEFSPSSIRKGWRRGDFDN
jgi:hypothetical protein